MKELERLIRKISSSAYVSGLNDTEHHEDEDKAKQAILKMFEEKDKKIAELEAQKEEMLDAEKLLVAVYEEWKDSENIKTPEMDGFELLNKIKDWVQEASHD
jgi:hypothetical protein